MIPKLESAEHVSGHAIRLRFADGTEGVVDLKDELWGEVFEPLRNIQVFRRFQLDRELNTLTWPSGTDFAPEFLCSDVQLRRCWTCLTFARPAALVERHLYATDGWRPCPDSRRACGRRD